MGLISASQIVKWKGERQFIHYGDELPPNSNMSSRTKISLWDFDVQPSLMPVQLARRPGNLAKVIQPSKNETYSAFKLGSVPIECSGRSCLNIKFAQLNHLTIPNITFFLFFINASSLSQPFKLLVRKCVP